MNFEDIKTKMESFGFRYQPNLRPHTYDTRLGLFYRRIETKRPCLSNDRDQFVVELYDYALLPTQAGLTGSDLENNRYSMSAEIVGEYATDTWAKLNIYGLSPAKFFEQHENILSALIRAWEALA